MSKPIFQVVDDLPTSSLTVRVLKALDWVVPGHWDNLVGFENTIRAVSGEDDPELVHKIGERAIVLYNDKTQGYQRALWLYQKVDTGQGMLGAAALAHKVGEKISLLSFLSHITPKPDTAQTIDLGVKLVVELAGFCLVNGIPGDSINDFRKSLTNYGKESLMRMAALVCLDGVLPLGPAFMSKVLGLLDRTGASELATSERFQRVQESIPGDSPEHKLGFIRESMKSVQDWISQFVQEHQLTTDKIVAPLRHFMDVADDKLAYLAAFLDIATNYYEHTGVQTVARSLISRATNEI
jgi:hypothetical protein